MLISTHYKNPKLSKTLEIGQLYKDLTKKGHKITNLGMGQSPFPIPQLLQDALKDNSHQADYIDIAGLHQLREALSDFYNQTLTQLPPYTASNIIITPGSKMAYFALQKVLDNQFIIPQPSWGSYLDQGQILSRSPILLQTTETTNWKITPSLLTQQISPTKLKNAVIILNNPNNPTGTIYTPKELKQLANIFKTYNITVIADEVYWMLSHATKKHTSIAHYIPEQTILVSSISKYFSAGGWRLGYIILPPSNPITPQLTKALKSVAANTYSCVSAPVQYATISAYKDLLLPPSKSTLVKELDKMNTIFNHISTTCYNILKTNAPTTILTSPSNGAFYFYLTFPNIPDHIDAAKELLTKHKILTISGEAFGTSKNTIRIAYTCFDGNTVINSFTKRNPAAIDCHLTELYEAFHTIAKWANDTDFAKII